MTPYLPKRRGNSRSLAQTTQWIGLSGVLRIVHTWQQEAGAPAHQHDALVAAVSDETAIHQQQGPGQLSSNRHAALH